MLSACLVSLEPEAHLRIFPSSFQHDERFVKNARYRTLTTPDDCSCTHILVFPTSPELNVSCFIGLISLFAEFICVYAFIPTRNMKIVSEYVYAPMYYI